MQLSMQYHRNRFDDSKNNFFGLKIKIIFITFFFLLQAGAFPGSYQISKIESFAK